MPIYSVQVALDHDSALGKDVTVNNWHVSGDLGANPGLVAQEFWDFYTSAPPAGTNTIAARLSAKLAGTGRIRLYNLADVKPRVPVVDQAFSGMITHTTALPGEVAVCLSFKANPTSGTNARRRRNRVYIGPLAHSTQESTALPMVTQTFREDLLKALQKLKDDVEAVTGGLATLVGYSPTDGVPFPIEAAWVDNAFDTQRSRGEAATIRSTAVIS